MAAKYIITCNPCVPLYWYGSGWSSNPQNATKYNSTTDADRAIAGIRSAELYGAEVKKV